MARNILTSLTNKSSLQCLITLQSSTINILKSEGLKQVRVGHPKIFESKEFVKCLFNFAD